jgi:hypothetical protein
LGRGAQRVLNTKAKASSVAARGFQPFETSEEWMCPAHS